MEKSEAKNKNKNKNSKEYDDYNDSVDSRNSTSYFGVENVIPAGEKRRKLDKLAQNSDFNHFLKSSFPEDFINDSLRKNSILENFSLVFDVDIVVCGDVLINFYHIPQSPFDPLFASGDEGSPLKTSPHHHEKSIPSISPLSFPSPPLISSSPPSSINSSPVNSHLKLSSFSKTPFPSLVNSSNTIPTPNLSEELLNIVNDQEIVSENVGFLKIFRYSFHTGMHKPYSFLSLSPANLDSPKSVLFTPNFKLVTLFKPASIKDYVPIHYKVDWNV
jgi:hypothetical protein